MKGTVEPSLSNSITASTCAARMPSSCANWATIRTSASCEDTGALNAVAAAEVGVVEDALPEVAGLAEIDSVIGIVAF